VRFIIPLLEPVRIQNTQRQYIEKTSAQVDQRLESSLAAKVIIKLQKEEAGKFALAQYLGHKSVSGELKNQIRLLLDLNLIEMTLPDKPTSRLQKYRLTRIGQELLDD
jgi:ATP-dependent DNA helicase RecG